MALKKEDTSHEKILDILFRNGAEWSEDWKIDEMTFLHKAVNDENDEAVKMIVSRNYYKYGDSDWEYARDRAKEKTNQKDGSGQKWININNTLIETNKKNLKMNKKLGFESK